MTNLRCKTDEVVDVLMNLGYQESEAWRLAVNFAWEKPSRFRVVRASIPERAYRQDGRIFIRA